MKPKRIILIRHGESEGNVDNTVYDRKPDYALALTDQGRHQAQAAGQKIKDLIMNESAFFYVSPHLRTVETFAAIKQSLSGNAIHVREEPRLREQEWGHLRSPEESQVIERARDAYGTFYFRIPDGESCADVYDRVTTFLETLHRDFQKKNYPQNTILVSHGMTMRLFLMRWFHWSVSEFETIANPRNCAVWLMELQANGKYLLQCNPDRHEVYHSFRGSSVYGDRELPGIR